MKNHFIAIIGLICLMATEAAGQITMDTDGDWNVGTNWAGNTAAGVGDDTLISGGGGKDATVVSSDDITVNTLELGNSSTITIDASGQLTIDNLGSDALTTNNTAEITVDGDLTINGNLVVNNGLILIVTGTLTINGDVVLKNNASLDFSAGSNTTITGDFTAGTNADITVNGTVAVGGNFTTGGGGGESIAGTGTLAVTGTCTGDLCGTGPLPIELLTFNARVADKMVIVDWSTASEEDFDYFTIERSNDGKIFSALAEIIGSGNSSTRLDYDYFDNQPIIGTSYYRLKATDLDGTVEIFDVVGINFVGTFNSKIYPNPAISNEITVQINDLKENVKVTVHSSGGDLVFADELNTLTSKVSLPENVENGIYIVTFLNSTTSQKHRLVLNR